MHTRIERRRTTHVHHDGLRQLDEREALEGPLPRTHLPHDDAEAVDVHHARVGLVVDHLEGGGGDEGGEGEGGNGELKGC